MRIISGKYGGRPLKAVKGTNTRPTTDKIKESLFHMIGPYFDGGIALDLYAGSGSLGIEAVSRGMDAAYLVDQYPGAITTIKENVAMTKEEDKFTIWKKKDTTALTQLKASGVSFDLVLLDPPYEKEDWTALLSNLVHADLLNPHALIVCETDKHTAVEPNESGYSKYKEKVYGTTKLVVYEWSRAND